MRLRTFRRRYVKRIGRPYRMRRKALTRQGKVYSFRRTVALTPCAIVAGVPTYQTGGVPVSNLVNAGIYNFGHFRFKLNDLPGSTDFTNLYERYKITGVKLKFIPVVATESSVGNGNPISPIALAINRGAITVASDDRTFDQLLENQDVRIMSTMKPFNVYIPYPKFYAPADGVTAAQEKGGWLNCKHPEIDHTGFNFAFQNTTTNGDTQTQWRVFATYYVKCANPQ